MVTRYGLRPLQFFSFKNISTNTVARGIISLVKILRVEGQVETEKSVFLKLFKYGLRNLAEIFTTYQAYICDDLTQRF